MRMLTFSSVVRLMVASRLIGEPASFSRYAATDCIESNVARWLRLGTQRRTGLVRKERIPDEYGVWRILPRTEQERRDHSTRTSDLRRDRELLARSDG